MFCSAIVQIGFNVVFTLNEYSLPPADLRGSRGLIPQVSGLDSLSFGLKLAGALPLAHSSGRGGCRLPDFDDAKVQRISGRIK